MARISLSKLVPLKKAIEIMVTINGTDVSVKQYLTITEKAELLQWVCSFVFDEQGFASPLRKDLYMDMGILKYYTNISFTEKAWTELDKTYDQLTMNGVVQAVKNSIPADELAYVENLIQETIDQVVKYNTSALGVLNNIKQNYDDTTLDAQKIAALMQDENSFKLVKDVLDKIG